MKFIYSFAASVLLIACQGEQQSEELGSPKLSSQIEQVESLAAKCTLKGGTMTIGGHGQPVCLETASDAGKQCSSSADCEGICLAEGQICSSQAPMYGCNDVYENGTIATLCVD